MIPKPMAGSSQQHNGTVASLSKPAHSENARLTDTNIELQPDQETLHTMSLFSRFRTTFFPLQLTC